ncbi:hypothetical protein JAAARDRAFT_139068, partial [Jaapia argillacea MUCL 33604]
LKREVVVWHGISHKYILPCFGVNIELFGPPRICLVSPFMENGTILEYTICYTLSHPEITHLLLQVAEGLEYLHDENIVHGDLRGANILINHVGHPQLADFGLAVFAEATMGAFTTTTSSGTMRWMAPELLYPPQFGLTDYRRTCPSDVFAYGCVCFELHTGSVPFHEICFEAAIPQMVLAGKHPSSPPRKVMPGGVLALAQKCWSLELHSRPTAQELVKSFGHLCEDTASDPESSSSSSDAGEPDNDGDNLNKRPLEEEDQVSESESGPPKRARFDS